MTVPLTSEISHHHKVTNITMSPTLLSPIQTIKMLREAQTVAQTVAETVAQTVAQTVAHFC